VNRLTLPSDCGRIHLQQTEVDRLVLLGATLLGTQGETVVMTDPDGNEFCVLPSQ
jgi:hypothetical protein